MNPNAGTVNTPRNVRKNIRPRLMWCMYLQCNLQTDVNRGIT